MPENTTITQRATGWAAGLEAAMAAGDQLALEDLFLEESYWRDLVAFTWDTRQFWGRKAVISSLAKHAQEVRPRGFRIDPDRSAPRILADGSTVEFFAAFETKHGTGSAFVLAEVDETASRGMRARLIATTLTGLACHPIPSATRRGYLPERPGETWLEQRRRAAAFADADPDVLVLGGSQSGLAMGAQLQQLGVSYLIVDRQARPGDTWRKRYTSLALHTPTYYNDLPYLRQPSTYPPFVSKDEWANYLDAYGEMMALNWWGSTELLSATFDDADRTWTVELRLADGGSRTMRPKHIVTAMGYTGTEPHIPDLPGLGDFAGQVLHSSQFDSGRDFCGKSVLVLGTGTSGHDIALDLSDHGATVALGQRSPTCVVPINEAERLNADYQSPSVSTEEIDQRRSATFVYPLLLKRARAETERTEQQYADLFAGLRAAGMTLTTGEEGGGWIMKLHQTFAGFYLDVGACGAITDGRISIVPWQEFETFDTEGVRMRDGSTRPLDAVVLATGYQNVRTTIERIFGPEVADRVGLVGGIDESGEHRNLARPTGQPNLWMLFGGVADTRRMSRLLALQVVAQLEGAAPTLVRSEDGGLRALEPKGEGQGAS